MARDLISFSSVATGRFSDATIVRQYVLLLGRIASGELAVGRPTSIVESLHGRYCHVFRGGTATPAAKRLHGQEVKRMKALIRGCRYVELGVCRLNDKLY